MLGVQHICIFCCVILYVRILYADMYGKWYDMVSKKYIHIPNTNVTSSLIKSFNKQQYHLTCQENIGTMTIYY